MLVHVHEPAKVEEEDKSDIEADTTTPTPTEAGAEAGAITPSGSVEVKQEIGSEPSGDGAELPKATGTENKGQDEEAEEEKVLVPVLLVLSPALRTACFQRDEEVMTVGGSDGTLFVGRAPTPPIVRAPVIDKPPQQPPQQQDEEKGVEQDADQSSSEAQQEGGCVLVLLAGW